VASSLRWMTQAPVELPKPDPANFTATSPTKEAVNEFLTQSLGFDENRIWEVEAIQKTPIEGFSKVIVYLGDKSGKNKPQELDFYVLPDGKHLIVVPPNDEIQAFGPKPYAVTRAELQQNANGPYKGAAGKDGRSRVQYRQRDRGSSRCDPAGQGGQTP